MSENNDFLNGFLDSNSGTSGGGFADLTLPDFEEGSQGTNPQKAEVDTATAPQAKVDVNQNQQQASMLTKKSLLTDYQEDACAENVARLTT